jgi:uncharacterized cupin superfamily protein
MKTKSKVNFLLLGSLVASLGGTRLMAQNTPSIIRYEPNGPGGKGLVGPNAKDEGTGDKKTTVLFYYQSSGPSKDASGIWEAVNYRTPLERTKESEFIHVLRGSLTLGYKDGREATFQAGDNLLIPRGAEVAWKGTQNLREYWVTFDSTGPVPAGSPAVIKFERDGPAGQGLKPTPPQDPWPAKEHDYYSGPTGSSAGVWETEPHADQKFDKPNYCELMVFLDGEVTLSTPDGKSQTFKAGDVALVPKGAAYKWRSGRLRKFWVIFDHDPGSATSSN